MAWIECLHIVAIAGFYGGAAFAWAGGRGMLIYAASVALGGAYLAGGWCGVAAAAAAVAALALLA